MLYLPQSEDITWFYTIKSTLKCFHKQWIMYNTTVYFKQTSVRCSSPVLKLFNHLSVIYQHTASDGFCCYQNKVSFWVETVIRVISYLTFLCPYSHLLVYSSCSHLLTHRCDIMLRYFQHSYKQHSSSELSHRCWCQFPRIKWCGLHSALANIQQSRREKSITGETGKKISILIQLTAASIDQKAMQPQFQLHFD